MLCREEYGVEVSPTHTLETDSTTPAKFSRHLLVRVPGVAFVDNRAAGAFVARLLAFPEVCKHVHGCIPSRVVLPAPW